MFQGLCQSEGMNVLEHTIKRFTWQFRVRATRGKVQEEEWSGDEGKREKELFEVNLLCQFSF